MAKRKRNNQKPTLENHLSWWNEVSLGVGILLGYLIFIIYSAFTPVNKIEIEVVTPIYSNKVIGMIPSSYKKYNAEMYKNITLYSYKKLVLDNPVLEPFPNFNSDGSPMLERKLEIFSGYGTPLVSSTKIEILKPMLENPSFRKLKTGKSYIFKPNIYYKGTGVYYEQKTVSFPDSLSADSFSIRTGAFFALISILLFLFKSRYKFKSWIDSLKEVKFDSNSDGED